MIEFLLLAIVAVPVYSLIKDHKENGGWYFFNPVNSFWIAFIYAGAVQPFLSQNKWIPYYGEATFVSTLAMFFVLGLAIHVGYNAKFGPTLARKIPNLPIPSAKKVFQCGVVLLAIGLLGFALVAAASGGWTRWSSNPRSYTNFNLSGYVYTLPRVATLGLMVLLCHAFSLRPAAHIYRLVIVGLALLNLAWQIYSGTREGTILMLIFLVGSIYGAQNRNPSLPAIGTMVALAFFAFGFIPTYRAQFRSLKFDTLDTPRQILDNSFDFYNHPDGGSADDTKPDLWSDFGMAISVNYFVPSKTDFDYGYMLLEPFTHAIPRGIWPDKVYPETIAWDRFHRVSGVSDVTNLEGLRGGPSPTMVGKYYYIGGWFGLMLGGFFSGTIFRAIGNYLRRNRDKVTGAIIGVASVGLGAMEMIHPLSWSVNLWLPTIGFPFFLMAWWVRDPNAKQFADDAISAVANKAQRVVAPLHPLLHPRFRRTMNDAKEQHRRPLLPPADLRSPRFANRRAQGQ